MHGFILYLPWVQGYEAMDSLCTRCRYKHNKKVKQVRGRNACTRSLLPKGKSQPTDSLSKKSVCLTDDQQNMYIVR